MWITSLTSPACASLVTCEPIARSKAPQTGHWKSS